ncbi:MAG: hypothetical protein P4L85_04180 [Paludisphaera borealis]|uniref:hypothetical protein n=1 Tax=Paludisphaera borealis TaxID=1387353 RepID=UPI002850FDDC|nr:hypothetical protein [Paludisphaera borealis]MDR3618526.1 hypothetical protein [Paludisphaera borealis]
MSHDAFSLSVLAALAAVAILMIVVALPVVLGMRHAAKDQEFQHAERLKAIEMGRPLPGDPAHEGSPRTAVAGIGVWVPISALVIALAATTGSQNSEAAGVAIWVSAGGVGVTGLICGTILAMSTMARDGRTADCHAPAKHRFEESEIDTVSRRGV